MVEILLEHRARLDTVTDTGYNPLHLAASGGNTVIPLNTLITNMNMFVDQIRGQVISSSWWGGGRRQIGNILEKVRKHLLNKGIKF